MAAMVLRRPMHGTARKLFLEAQPFGLWYVATKLLIGRGRRQELVPKLWRMWGVERIRPGFTGGSFVNFSINFSRSTNSLRGAVGRDAPLAGAQVSGGTTDLQEQSSIVPSCVASFPPPGTTFLLDLHLTERGYDCAAVDRLPQVLVWVFARARG